jgi:hypothetical protein
MQNLEPPAGLCPFQARDALTCTGITSPPSILLDFMYGVAAYKRWHGGHDIDAVMKERFADKYESIPQLPASDSSDDSDGGSERKDPRDGDCEPNRRRSWKHRRSSMSDGMLRAMDGMNALSMFMRGITPQTIAAERQRREEEEERRAQEDSRAKVELWMR